MRSITPPPPQTWHLWDRTWKIDLRLEGCFISCHGRRSVLDPHKRRRFFFSFFFFFPGGVCPLPFPGCCGVARLVPCPGPVAVLLKNRLALLCRRFGRGPKERLGQKGSMLLTGGSHASVEEILGYSSGSCNYTISNAGIEGYPKNGALCL